MSSRKHWCYLYIISEAVYVICGFHVFLTWNVETLWGSSREGREIPPIFPYLARLAKKIHIIHFHPCAFSASTPNFHEFHEQFVFPTKPSLYLLSSLSVKCVRVIENFFQNAQNLFISSNHFRGGRGTKCFFFQEAFVIKQVTRKRKI